jgi:hypothetical protein
MTRKSAQVEVDDTVIYTENGEDYVATVLATRNLDDHLGADDQPLLHLGFFAQVMMPGPDGKPVARNLAGTGAQELLANFRHDVAHVSHEYSEEYQKEHNVTIYPGGRWTEAAPVQKLGPEAKKPGEDEDHPLLGKGDDDDDKDLVGKGSAPKAVNAGHSPAKPTPKR